MRQSVQVRISSAVGAVLFLAAAIPIWAISKVNAEIAPLTVPIAIGPILFYSFGKPWRLRTHAKPIPASIVLLASVGFLFGLIIESVLLATIAWILFFHSWLDSQFVDNCSVPRLRLETLLLFSFPWIVHDGQWISELFQYSGAVVAELWAQGLGFDVVRVGQNLLIGETQLSIGPACSGIQTLQITMLCGSALAVIFLGRLKIFWCSIPVLITLAWIINSLRIIGLVCLAHFGSSPELVTELHDTTGYLAILLEVPLILLAFKLLERLSSRGNARSGARQSSQATAVESSRDRAPA